MRDVRSHGNISFDKVSKVRSRDKICNLDEHADHNWLGTTVFGHFYPKTAECDNVCEKGSDILECVLSSFHEDILFQRSSFVGGVIEHLFDFVVLGGDDVFGIVVIEGGGNKASTLKVFLRDSGFFSMLPVWQYPCKK